MIFGNSYLDLYTNEVILISILLIFLIKFV